MFYEYFWVCDEFGCIFFCGDLQFGFYDSFYIQIFFKKWFYYDFGICSDNIVFFVGDEDVVGDGVYVFKVKFGEYVVGDGFDD